MSTAIEPVAASAVALASRSRPASAASAGGDGIDRTVAATEEAADRAGQFAHVVLILRAGRPGIVTAPGRCSPTVTVVVYPRLRSQSAIPAGRTAAAAVPVISSLDRAEVDVVAQPRGERRTVWSASYRARSKRRSTVCWTRADRLEEREDDERRDRHRDRLPLGRWTIPWRGRLQAATSRITPRRRRPGPR